MYFTCNEILCLNALFIHWLPWVDLSHTVQDVKCRPTTLHVNFTLIPIPGLGLWVVSLCSFHSNEVVALVPSSHLTLVPGSHPTLVPSSHPTWSLVLTWHWFPVLTPPWSPVLTWHWSPVYPWSQSHLTPNCPWGIHTPRLLHESSVKNKEKNVILRKKYKSPRVIKIKRSATCKTKNFTLTLACKTHNGDYNYYPGWPRNSRDKIQG